MNLPEIAAMYMIISALESSLAKRAALLELDVLDRAIVIGYALGCGNDGPSFWIHALGWALD